MPRATQGTSEAALNQLNLQMRQQPWYQQWFASKGLNPNQVRLSENQRRELAQVAAQNGYQLGDRMKIDEAGNLNQQGGWAGLPTAAKWAIGGGVTAASMGLIPGVPGVGALFGGGGSGVGSAGMGPGVNAAQAGAAAHAGSPLLMGGGKLLPMVVGGAGAAIPTARELLDDANDVPTIPSNPIGGMGTGPTDIGKGAFNGADMVWDAATQTWKQKAGNFVKDALTGDGGTPDWLGPVMAALAGLPALMANKGPSDEERAFQAQASRLLAQQERRTTFQDPLYEAVSKMAYNLQPIGGTGGAPYRYNTLGDVNVPSMDELIAQQRRG